jgi:stearoyl-CoA desaturase (delta-9 desaturase)
MGVLCLGDGWHANHHRFPWSARHGLEARQWDFTYGVIRVLRALGLARAVRVVTAEQLQAARAEVAS